MADPGIDKGNALPAGGGKDERAREQRNGARQVFSQYYLILPRL